MSINASGLPGKGTLLKYQTAAGPPAVFATIGNRVEITGPDPEVGIRNPTHLDSQYVAKRPNIVDLGQLTMTLFYDPNDTNHMAIRAKVFTPPTTPDTFELVFNDGKTSTNATDTFQGYVTKFTPNGMTVEDTVGADVTIEITDSYSFAAGS